MTLNVLMQILRATAKSSGNAHVVYPLLQANLDKLNDEFADVLREWAKNTLPKLLAEISQELASTVCDFCLLLEQFPNGDRESIIEIVIIGYEISSIVLNQESFPEKWVEIQTEIGVAYKNRIRGDQVENLETAISIYQKVLAVCIQYKFYRKLALAQDNLCNAYKLRTIGDRSENLEIAVQAAEFALENVNRQEFPVDWALIQTNLASTYWLRIHGKPEQNLKLAVAKYQEALQVFDQQNSRQYSILVKNNLDFIGGQINILQKILNVIVESNENPIKVVPLLKQPYCIHDSFINVFRAGILYKSEQIKKSELTFFWLKIMTLCEYFVIFTQDIQGSNIEISISGYELLSTILTRKDSPLLWALNQVGLGTAYNRRKRGDRSENLERSIQFFSAASEEFRRDGIDPGLWAANQDQLGVAYLYRIRGDHTENLELAIRHFIAALAIRDRQRAPQAWAETTINLGEAYRNRIREVKAENLEKARSCFLEAVEEVTQENNPYSWARAQSNLGNVYQKRIWGEKAENLEKAIECYQLALRVRTREDLPTDWATTQNNLGLAYLERIRGDRAENLEISINHFRAALQIRTREASPWDWATTQSNLAGAYLLRVREKKAENLEAAIDCYKAALKVYTSQPSSQKYIETIDNLGNVYFKRVQGDKSENIEIAIEFHLAALYVLEQKSLPETWAKCQINLGASYQRRIEGERIDNFMAAINCYQSALSIFTSQAFPEHYISTQFNLGFVYQEINELSHAYDAFRLAIDAVELARDEIATSSGREQDKKKLAEQWNQLYKKMVEACLDLDKCTEAIEYVERSKTRNLVEQILNRDLKTIFPADVVTQLETYRDEIATKQYEIQHGKAENPNILIQYLQELRQQRNELQNHYLPIGSGFQFDQFQQNLENHTAIVEFYFTGRQLLTFIFTHQTQQPIIWRSQRKDLDKLEKWIKGYLIAKKSYWKRRLATRLRLLAKILHINEVIQQIPEDCNQLIFIPYQILHLLPLHALSTNSQQEEGATEILMHRFPAGVSYAPSCQLLQLAQKRDRHHFTNLFAIQNATQDLNYTDLDLAPSSRRACQRDKKVKKRA